MTQFLTGWIRQLTERSPPPDSPFKIAGTVIGRVVPDEYRKQRNILIQSTAADIVTKLIAADIIQSQRWDQVDEIVREVLFKAFGGTGLEQPPQPIVKSR